MNFKELLKTKNISGYTLSKITNIPYTTISDLMNGKTNVKNISLKHALSIADCLRINVRFLSELDNPEFVDFRYFRNEYLNELKREGFEEFVAKIIKGKIIDYYYKNDGKDRALYLLALVDYLSRINNKPIYQNRYNQLRKQKLDKPLFVGSDLINFDSIEEAEDALKIKVIPEFKNMNIIEEDVFDVA